MTDAAPARAGLHIVRATFSLPRRNFARTYASTGEVAFFETGSQMKIPTLIAMLAAAMLGGLALIFLVM
ncbi:MAG TPA: hypothetical protein VEC01_07825 [Noviherbaspirillum sp.]|uniref:hypothetical protein n=1 Tax=Noviherbaspirillum sp. TaxID=1926288 RepID=UPI002D2F523B|nr:hypothetical protein [Noviherbaspirillum sp.]HYD95218.1 hypothetical protein [Noviherbaspirillum sp.]